MTPIVGMPLQTSPSRKHTVSILNPIVMGSSYTNLRKANKFVSSGRAIWVGNAIEFIKDPRRLYLALVAEKRLSMDQAGYDGIGLITLDQAQGLPLAGPAERLFSKGGRFTPKRDSCRTISKTCLQP